MALQRHGDKGRAGAQGQRIVQRRRQFAKLMHSASSRDGVLRKRERGARAVRARQLRGRFAHAHYRFQKRPLLVPFRCDLIAHCQVYLSVPFHSIPVQSIPVHRIYTPEINALSVNTDDHTTSCIVHFPAVCTCIPHVIKTLPEWTCRSFFCMLVMQYIQRCGGLMRPVWGSYYLRYKRIMQD